MRPDGAALPSHRDGRHKDQEARVGFTLKQRVVRCFSFLAPCEPSYTRPVTGELERLLRPGGDRQIAFPNMRARPVASQKTPARLSGSFAYGCREGRCDDSEYVELAWTISTITPSQPRRSLVNIDLTDGINADLPPSHRRSRRCAGGEHSPSRCSQPPTPEAAGSKSSRKITPGRGDNLVYLFRLPFSNVRRGHCIGSRHGVLLSPACGSRSQRRAPPLICAGPRQPR